MLGIVMMLLTAIFGYRKYLHSRKPPLCQILYLQGNLYFVTLAGKTIPSIQAALRSNEDRVLSNINGEHDCKSFGRGEWLLTATSNLTDNRTAIQKEYAYTFTV
jgi:hypothetical protein